MVGRFYSSILIFLTFFVVGCSTRTYEASDSIKHVYITDTQAKNHTLSGVVIKYRGDLSNTVVAAVGQMLYMSKLDCDVYINREKVGTFNVSKPEFEAFVKLPPGEHEFAYKIKMRSIFTLGISTDKSFFVYKFVVPKNTIGKIILTPYMKNSKTRELEIEFEDIPYFELVGRCHNDYGNCSPI